MIGAALLAVCHVIPYGEAVAHVGALVVALTLLSGRHYPPTKMLHRAFSVVAALALAVDWPLVSVVVGLNFIVREAHS
jgi:hypothetical protein